MSKAKRARYTLEFKIEAVRLVRGDQSVAAVSQVLGAASQTLDNWVQSDEGGLLKGTAARPVSPEQMEISRLRAELARTKMEHDILKRATAYFAKESECRTPGSSATGGAGRCRCSARCWG